MKHWAGIAMLGALAAASPAWASQGIAKTVVSGGRVELSVRASDPDGDPLTFAWETTGGRIVGSGPSVTFDASGLAAGRYTATVTVSDTLCEASTSIAIDVVAPPAPAPAAGGHCPFGRDRARVDNACKAVLDDVVLRLERDPRLLLVVDGHAASGERAGVALRRAEAASGYLVNERGVDAGRVVVRSFDDRCGAGDRAGDARVELFLLPEGIAPGEIVKSCR